MEAPRQVQLPVWPEHLLRKNPLVAHWPGEEQSTQKTPKAVSLSALRITISRYAAGSKAWCDENSSPSNVMVIVPLACRDKTCSSLTEAEELEDVERDITSAACAHSTHHDAGTPAVCLVVFQVSVVNTRSAEQRAGSPSIQCKP